MTSRQTDFHVQEILDEIQVPLLEECDPGLFKLYFIDIGLVGALLRLDLDVLDLFNSPIMIFSGAC